MQHSANGRRSGARRTPGPQLARAQSPELPLQVPTNPCRIGSRNGGVSERGVGGCLGGNERAAPGKVSWPSHDISKGESPGPGSPDVESSRPHRSPAPPRTGHPSAPSTFAPKPGGNHEAPLGVGAPPAPVAPRNAPRQRQPAGRGRLVLCATEAQHEARGGRQAHDAGPRRRGGGAGDGGPSRGAPNQPRQGRCGQPESAPPAE